VLLYRKNGLLCSFLVFIMIDDELERFKTLVNLSEFAALRGFKLDRRESSRNSAVMHHPDGDNSCRRCSPAGFR